MTQPTPKTQSPPRQLYTPIYHKTAPDMPWPPDPVFYLLTRSGLFLCRNHEYFISSVPAPEWPCELATHRAFTNLRFPKIPRRLFELAVGFFTRIYQLHRSEAGLLLVWSAARQRMRLVCPPQLATVSRGRYGGAWPIGLHYDIPNLGDDILLGDLHSHGDESAYASGVDKLDEQDRPAGSIHLVVGRCGDVLIGKRPDLHIETVADGMRFHVKPALILEGYARPRMNVPRDWINKVKVEVRGGGMTNDDGLNSGTLNQNDEGNLKPKIKKSK